MIKADSLYMAFMTARMAMAENPSERNVKAASDAQWAFQREMWEQSGVLQGLPMDKAVAVIQGRRW